MSESSENQAPPGSTPVPSEDRLDTWKEIAAYLRREVRTVQRWEREQGLPIHRHLHRKRGSVYAYKHELDSWWHSHEQEVNRPDTSRTASKSPSGRASGPGQTVSRWAWIAGFAGILLGLAAVWQLSYRPPAIQTDVEVSPLTTLPGREVGPSLSPDGTRIAYAANEGSENYEIFVEVIGAGDPLQITGSPHKETSPEWSPDGSRIAFVRHLAGDEAEIAVVPAMGGTEHRVASTTVPYLLGGREYRLLSWSRDEQWLLHAAHGVNSPGTLYRVAVDSGERVKLFDPPPFPGGDYAPAVSPDGRWLAFIRCASLGRCAVAQAPLTADYLPAEDPVEITSNLGVARSPVWTPNGSELIYSCGPVRGRRRLWRVPGGPQRGESTEIPGPGEGAVVVATGPVPESERDSRDNMRVVYTQVVFDIDVYRAELASLASGRVPPTKIIASTRRDWHPQLSPDRSRLAFSSDRSGEYGIWVSGADGANPTLLATFDGTPSGFPYWSPDGTTLAVEAHPHGNADIYSVPASGGAPVRLTTSPAHDSRPAWSRDGSSIYFISNRSGRAEVWKIPAAGESASTPAVQVTDGGAEYAQETWDGQWLVFSRGPLSTALQMASTSGDEVREAPVIGRLAGAYSFSVSEPGVHYVSFVGAEQQSVIGFYNLQTGESETPIPIEQPPMGSFTTSRDGTTIIFSRLERLEGDLMLVRGLR